ncbi:NAD(P)-dependent oxidoreductase [Marinicella litoralis]|uniref:Glyoxylate/hydroxypyruvate reductase A n=1 Tax=Marinicella litoralis TaxID=644220 RepID=A0A4R6XRU2_9GAMM|nr:NAD(P)-dependent oxidoreductase [Marinicella litoralis]TDR20734.1 glyoxylate/hydroxypyruvate reductase A [Marinicella litoralis]
MSIAVIITDRNTDELCTQLAAQLPHVKIQQWPDIPDPESVQLAVLWNHPEGITQPMRHLKMVVSMGAGMDHIDADPFLAADVIRQRIVTLALKQNMAQYVLQPILAVHRQHKAYQVQQAKQQWQVLETAEKTPLIGFLGLGELGQFLADQCAALGFATMAWTRSQNNRNHRCFHGDLGLQQVCSASDFLVVLLPLTTATHGIINLKTLSWCKPTARLINVARGGHVIEPELITALDKGLINHAVLDVFQQEPLPPKHPFWTHPKITITPHSSARSDVKQTAEHIVAYYQQIQAY